MHKCSRKKTQLYLLSVFFAFFVLSFILIHDDASTKPGDDGGRRLILKPSFPTFTTTNASTHKTEKWVVGELPSGASDWSKATKACAHTQSYNGRPSSRVKYHWGKESRSNECNAFSGRWVYDNYSYPLYDEAGCPYMSDQLACRKHGRPDRDYQKWRWQPRGCDLKRWNATEMLEKLRGKRLMFVGDSLNRGQWISMVCLVQSVIPSGKKLMTPNSALTKFIAKEYNASIEFYWAPLIVESNSDDPINHRLSDRIIRPDSLLRHASEWAKADILVFNSYLWWRSGPKIKLLWSYSGGVCEEADGKEAMKLALETWADWIESSVNPLKHRVFFVTMSPTHLWSQEWNPGSDGNCFQEKAPIEMEGHWGNGSDLNAMQMVDEIMARLGPIVTVLNITQLSEYRKDGHPSIYRKFWETLSQQQLANPVSYADCIHWCLPGVPDVWNELLFNSL
ncbi:protein trichome birefringence-like 35 [Typha latifolia]|uniref:protein trichome birefringence-like 35 n=1 Tax=Typha latifolia TaxID=4733 RepID=UPI003C2F53D5